jgi:hypothetical protein
MPKFLRGISDVAPSGTVPIECFTEMAALNAEMAQELDVAEAKIRELSRLLIEERARVTELTLKIADYIRIWDAQITRRAP